MDTERLVENETALGFDNRDLLAEIDRLEAELRHYRDHAPARPRTIPFEECEADICEGARKASA